MATDLWRSSLELCVLGIAAKAFFLGNDQMAEGTIKRITDKGFGFIDVGSEKDLFFHSSSVEGCSFDDLREGQKVSFNEAQGQKGPCAENVQVV
jgi:CspA family cold shock protein